MTVMPNITRCLEWSSLYQIHRTCYASNRENTFVLASNNILAFGVIKVKFLIKNIFARRGYPVVHARNIIMLNLSTFHHTNFGELLVY